MRHTHCRTWDMARNSENEKYTLQDLDYGKKTHKQGKWENHMVGR